MLHPDLHMHTVYSDGTDSPERLFEKIITTGIDFFSVTDHDSLAGSLHMRDLLSKSRKKKDTVFLPDFVTGIEFSCEDENGKYHILGYAYDPEKDAIRSIVNTFHEVRMEKICGRFRFLKDTYGFTFPQEEIEEVLALPSPGKPHIGAMMVKYGYAPNLHTAIEDYLSNYNGPELDIRPEEAIEAIKKSCGIPVLAHGIFGDGSKLLSEADFTKRVAFLADVGLMGLECFYPRYSAKQQDLLLALRKKFDLLATAGSDYHGLVKRVELGDTGFGGPKAPVPALQEFTEECRKRPGYDKGGLIHDN